MAAVDTSNIIILGIFLIITRPIFGAVTKEQMESAGKMMKDVCFPKYKQIGEEAANNIRNGAFPEDKNVKCYVNCMMELMGAMKKGKFNYESTMKQIEILIPDEWKEGYKSGIEKCKDSIKGVKDHCEGSYTLLKCFKNNVENFYFP